MLIKYVLIKNDFHIMRFFILEISIINDSSFSKDVANLHSIF